MSLSFTLVLIIIIVIISLQGFNNQSFQYKYALSPYDVVQNKKYYQLISHMFLHADWTHLLFNVISFYMFGEFLEIELAAAYGSSLAYLHFFVLFFLGGLFSTLLPLIRNHTNPNYLSLGASGAVSSIVFATMLWQPQMELGLIFLPGISIPAYIFAPLYLIFEWYAFRKGKSNIAHDAHIGGSIFGIIYILLINFEKGKLFIFSFI
ncbi:MAG: rhomboid family intramembrane serine protease [Flavobacteriia bacterium]|nr:rhomboid family intramembrane serine protease [Flavobacteriia bacterium]